VVHITGGCTALLATSILGPRRGRFHDDTGRKLEVPNKFPGHSVALQMLGTFILWFGWYGFNGGSAFYLNNREANTLAALATTNSTLAAGTAGITALMINLWYLERTTGEPYFDLIFAMNGALSGLVSITGGCGVVEPWSAVVIGLIGGIVYFLGSYGLERYRLDDAVDAIPVHMFCGIWGVLAVGLFASPKYLLLAHGTNHHPGLLYSSDATLLGCQIVGLIFIIGWVTLIMLPFFIWLDWKGWFRSDPLEELVGLDLSYHGGFPLLLANSSHGRHPDDENGVNPEYITAYRRKREESRLHHPRHYRHHSNNNNNNNMEDDDYVNDEDDDENESPSNTNSHDPIRRLTAHPDRSRRTSPINKSAAKTEPLPDDDLDEKDANSDNDDCQFSRKSM
jgi:Ammonium Transporter Family